MVRDPFDGAQLTREIILLRSPATAPEKKLLRVVDMGADCPYAW
jgi:hypothetical protein